MQPGRSHLSARAQVAPADSVPSPRAKSQPSIVPVFPEKLANGCPNPTGGKTFTLSAPETFALSPGLLLW